VTIAATPRKLISGDSNDEARECEGSVLLLRERRVLLRTELPELLLQEVERFRQTPRRVGGPPDTALFFEEAVDAPTVVFRTPGNEGRGRGRWMSGVQD